MHDHPGQAFRAEARLVDARRRRSRRRRARATPSSPPATAARCSRRALFVLGRLPGVERPAIVTVLPTPSGPLVLCDAGANVEPKAVAARAVRRARRRLRSRRPRPRAPAPRPALQRRRAGQGHAAHARGTRAARPRRPGAFQYIGYVEGSDLFRGVVDVIATDGFTGNVVLKTCEGIAEGMFGLVAPGAREDAARAPRLRARRARAARSREADRLHRDRRRAPRRRHQARRDRARPQRRHRDRERDPRGGTVRRAIAPGPARCRSARSPEHQLAIVRYVCSRAWRDRS